MKVWVDGSAFENNRQHGVWRVFYEIISRTKSDIDYTLWLRNTPQRPIPEGVRIYQDIGRHPLTPGQLMKRWERRRCLRNDPPELLESDLFHSTSFTSPISNQVRSIITVHDMIAESHFPICIREVEEGICIKRHALERASGLPCDSHSTKKELLAFYPHMESKASVVTLGYEHLLESPCDATQANAQHLRANNGSQNVLYVGLRMGYKNFFVLLEAMRHANWPQSVILKVIGLPFSEAEEGLIEKFGLTRRISHLGTVTDQHLKQIYTAARCLVFPSFQEGFGLPCLEAQANHCPLICSNIEVFQEVAGDAALYFDPRMGEALAEQVHRVGDPELRNDLIRRGHENLNRFSWNESARQMLQFYEQVLNGPH